MKTNKVWKIISVVLESAIVLCASGFAAAAYFDGLYKIAAFFAVIAVAGQIVVCVRTRQKWIPVEECVPEDWEYVLVSLEDEGCDVGIGYYESYEGGASGAFYIEPEEARIAVTAWMPLPKQYGGKCK